MDNPYFVVAGRLIQVLDKLREFHDEITVNQVRYFLAVAMQPGIKLYDLHRNLGASDGVASRTVALLSDLGSRGTPGLGLITVKMDPLDRRHRVLEITPKGHAVMREIIEHLDFKSHINEPG